MKKIAAVVFLLGMMVVCSGSAMASTSGYVDPNGSLGSGTFDTSDALKSLARAILVVMIIGAAAIYVAKKVMPKVNAVMGKEMKIVESLSLGSRKQVYIVKVGSRKLLIGGGADSITYLADVTDAVKEGGKNE